MTWYDGGLLPVHASYRLLSRTELGGRRAGRPHSCAVTGCTAAADPTRRTIAQAISYQEHCPDAET